ncbi:MAG: ABC transporter permease [Actinomycetota bacterium]
MSENKTSLWQRYLSANPVTMSFLAIFLGFVVGAAVIIFSSSDVLHAWTQIFNSPGAILHAIKVTLDNVGAAYRAMFTGSVFDPTILWHALTTGQDWTAALTPISETLTYAAPLVIISIGVAISFETGLFNIGANGQAILGGIAGTAFGSMIHLPMFIHLPLTLACGVAAGAFYGFIPGVLKALTGAHEVIVTLMLNYVVAFFLLYSLLSTPLQLPGQVNDLSRVILPSAQLPNFFATTTTLRVSWGILIAIGVVAFGWWFLNRSTLGFDFRITGANPNAARASGINPKKIIMYVFLISGGLAGLAGVVQVDGTTHSLDGGFLIGSAGIGFTAITVSLLGRNKPINVFWGAILFSALGVGGRIMQAETGIPLDLATIIQSAVVLFVATPVMVQEIFRLREGTLHTVELNTKGWSS